MAKQMSRRLTEEFDKDDVIQLMKRDRDIEKRIKEIVADVIAELFHTLWTRRSVDDSELKR